MRWLMGILVSFVFAWIVAYFFSTTILIYEWEPALQKPILKDGSVRKFRKEGRGTSVIGKLGVHGIPDISVLQNKKVAFWGDSFVEAWHVNDQEKMAQIFTKLYASIGLKYLTGFGVGRSGSSVADYYFEIPKYEAAISGIAAHCIVFSQLGDVLPDQPTSLFSQFVSSPEYRFIKKNPPLPRNPKIIAELSAYHLDFIVNALVSLRSKIPLRFLPGRKSPGNGKIKARKTKEAEQAKKAWSFLLKNLKQQTDKPLFFVYLPLLPRIENKSVSFINPDREMIESFATACQNYNVGFVDMSNQFIDFYKNTKLFPRGFSNSRPSLGHLNKQGHKLVATRVSQYINMTINK